MSNHTPGPWNWCHPDASASILHGAQDDPMTTGILVALGHECCAERREQGGAEGLARNCALTNRPTRDADLRLIAAAPDLLAACKAMLAADGTHGYSAAGVYEARKMMAEAIAKAEGLDV